MRNHYYILKRIRKNNVPKDFIQQIEITNRNTEQISKMFSNDTVYICTDGSEDEYEEISIPIGGITLKKKENKQ